MWPVFYQPHHARRHSRVTQAVDKYQYYDHLKDSTTYKCSGFDEHENFVHFEHIDKGYFIKMMVGPTITAKAIFKALSSRFGDKRKRLTGKDLPELHDLPERVRLPRGW